MITGISCHCSWKNVPQNSTEFITGYKNFQVSHKYCVCVSLAELIMNPWWHFLDLSGFNRKVSHRWIMTTTCLPVIIRLYLLLYASQFQRCWNMHLKKVYIVIFTILPPWDSMRHFLKSMLVRNITMNLEFKAIKVFKPQFPKYF